MDRDNENPDNETPESCEQVEPLLAAAALGALDPADAILVARHLESCRRCRHQYADLLRAADMLGWAVPQHTPVPELRERTLAALRPAPVRRLHPAMSTRVWAAVAAALIVALIGSNVLLWRQSNRPESAAETTPSGQVASFGPLAWYNLASAQPDSKGWGILCAQEQGRLAWLIVEDLPSLPANRVYQAWLQSGGRRSSAAVFTVDGNGRAFVVIRLDQPISSFQTVGVTDEPAGGSPSPTGKRVLFVAL